MDFSNLQFSDFLLLISCTTLFSIAIFVYSKGTKSPTHIFFSLSLTSLSLYVLSNFLIDIVSDEVISLFWVRASGVFISLQAVNFYLFSRFFISRFSLHSNVKRIIFSFSIVAFFSILSFTPWIIEDVKVDVYPVSVVRGSLYYSVISTVMIFLIAAVYIILKSYKAAYKFEKYQIKYFLTGVLISVSIAIFTNIFLPLIGESGYSRIGPTVMVVFGIMSGYALIKTNLFDLRVLLVKGAFFVFSVLGYFFFFSQLYLLFSKRYGSIYNSESVILSLIFSSMGLLGVYYLRNLETRVLQTFDRANKLQLVSRVNTILSQDYNLQRTVDLIEKEIEVAFSSKKVDIYSEGQLEYVDFGLKQVLSYDDLLIRKLRHRPLSSLESQALVYFAKHKIDLVIPITLKKEVIGQVLLKEKKMLVPYNSNEILSLVEIAQVIAVGLKKIMLYDEVQDFNLTLEYKIDKATAKLRLQKQKLQEKYQFEKDMMGIMGHELRTPMTVAKGMAELVLAKAKADNLEAGYVADKMKKIYDSIVKESGLIQTMLSTSHIDNNKLNLQISEVNLLELIEYSVLAYKKEAIAKGLDILYDEPTFHMPKIASDVNRLQEIANNLISNAVKYTKEGHVKVFIEMDDEFIRFGVEDTGIGIPKDEIQNLGKKFHRIQQHLDAEKQVVRAGGTGLGLYVVKGLLKALGGELIVESELGKGSTFIAVLPIKSKFHDNVFITKGPIDDLDMFAQLGFKKDGSKDSPGNIETQNPFTNSSKTTELHALPGPEVLRIEDEER